MATDEESPTALKMRRAGPFAKFILSGQSEILRFAQNDSAFQSRHLGTASAQVPAVSAVSSAVSGVLNLESGFRPSAAPAAHSGWYLNALVGGV